MQFNQTKVILLIILFFTSAFCHKCGKMKAHDLGVIDLGNNEQDYDEQNRNLASQQIRLTYDDSSIRSNELLPYLSKIQVAVETAFNFYRQFVKVKIPITQDFYAKQCMDYNFSAQQKTQAIKNTDMHFYLNALYDNSDWIARAGACVVQNVDQRPIMGLIEFNTKFLQSNLNNFQFQDLVETTIHEVFHALAFSSNLFEAYKGVNLNQFSTSSVQETWIAFPNVLAFVKKHFNCQQITKVKLENDGGKGSAGTHWERTLFQNDIMTASEVTGDNTWSGINNALMQDSGWYDVDLDFHEKLFWGKNKGCDFFDNQCKANPRPEEFCDPTDATAPLNGFHFTGYSKCSSSDTFMDQKCSYQQPYTSSVCYNPDNNTNKNAQPYIESGASYGWDSKSVSSTLQPKGFMQYDFKNTSQCYPQKCIVDNQGKQNIEFTIGKDKKKLTCQTDKQVLKLDGYNGQLTCPVIADFCERQYNCQDLCNSGGFCMNQKCYCTPGFSGPNCECGNGVSYKNSFCEKCTSKNCQACNENNQCTKCDPQYQLDNFGNCVQKSQIVSGCAQGYSLDKSGFCVQIVQTTASYILYFKLLPIFILYVFIF